MKNELRPETGIMQFGEDWPGVFIRGDNAGYYAICLRMSRDHPGVDPMADIMVNSLIELLESSNAHDHAATDPDIQMAVMHGAGYRYCAERGMVEKDTSLDKK